MWVFFGGDVTTCVNSLHQLPHLQSYTNLYLNDVMVHECYTVQLASQADYCCLR